MKTLKELQEHGLNYLIGYTDALADFANLLIDDPDLYDPCHNQAILNFMNKYLSELLQEGCEKSVTE